MKIFFLKILFILQLLLNLVNATEDCKLLILLTNYHNSSLKEIFADKTFADKIISHINNDENADTIIISFFNNFNFVIRKKSPQNETDVYNIFKSLPFKNTLVPETIPFKYKEEMYSIQKFYPRNGGGVNNLV